MRYNIRPNKLIEVPLNQISLSVIYLIVIWLRNLHISISGYFMADMPSIPVSSSESRWRTSISQHTNFSILQFISEFRKNSWAEMHPNYWDLNIQFSRLINGIEPGQTGSSNYCRLAKWMEQYQTCIYSAE